MKSTGIIRNFDELGRIVVPIDIRRSLGMGNNSRLEVWKDGDRIILQKIECSCRMCGSSNELTEIEHEKHICGDCVAQIVKLV